MNERPTSAGISRVIVALDASRHSEAALEAAARICGILDADLVGVFVEDVNVLRAAELPFTADVRRITRSSIDLSRPSVHRLFRAQAERARRAFDWTVRQHRLRNEFRVTTGTVADELLDASEGADLITLGQSGSVGASRGKLGSVTLSVLERAAGPVLVLRRGLRLDLPVVLLYDCEAGDRFEALAIASDLAGHHPDSPLVVLLAGPGAPACDAAREEVESRTPAAAHPLVFERVRSDVPELVVEHAHRRRAGLIVVPAGSRGADTSRLRRLVASAETPIMVVRGVRGRVPAP